MRDITVAAVCMHSRVGHVKENLERMERFLDEAVSRGCDIVCFPELSISGYKLNSPQSLYDHQFSQYIIARVVELAQDKEVVILAGMIEVRAKGLPYISQLVTTPFGLMGIYRKTHLSPMEEGNFAAGDEIAVFSHDGVTFGVQLCWEAHFPELSTIMALKGVEIIFMPHASPRTGPNEKFQSWLRHMRSRAYDNATYIVACNQVGPTSEGYIFPGVAIIIDPAGHIMAYRAEETEGMIVTTLKAELITAIKSHPIRYFLPHRRPELYKDLTRNPIGRTK